MTRFKRVLLKVSGETFMGDKKDGIFDKNFMQYLAEEIKAVHQLDVQMGIVVGGGNIMRWNLAADFGFDRVNADYMGMLATVINGLALQDVLEKNGVDTRMQTMIEMKAVAEPFIRRRALRHMDKGRVVILAAGTGSPYVTTDTGAALKVLELKAEVLLKATKVNGVYSEDPMKNRQAKLYRRLSFSEALKNEKIKVMDSAAISLCMENKVPIIVFNIHKKGYLAEAIKTGEVGTLVA